MFTVAIVGAYGNFGSIIFSKISKEMPSVKLLLIGRNEEKLKKMTFNTGALYWAGDATHPEFTGVLRSHSVNLVIHTAGPFQNQDYAVPRAAISAGSDYCDLSDSREFVNGITCLNDEAKRAGVRILSGCSSVPALSSSVIDHYLYAFTKIEEIDFCISSSAKMPGVSTVRGVMEYAGKPVSQFLNGSEQDVYGWQNLRLRKFPDVGYRLLANVDVPDMDVFPGRYNAQTVRFQAGSGLKLGTLANFFVAGLVRMGIVRSGASHADWLHYCGSAFARFGDGKSLMSIDLKGKGRDQRDFSLSWKIIATNDKGPVIPSSGAVALTKILSNGDLVEPGARPCIGVITLAQYLDAIGTDDIRVECMK
jgi:saccharopine dehydrogenase-like NADP-dependent oxidoreductase